jgi:phage baseplate assembly protein W
MPRADRQTETSVQQELYSDFSIDFSKNPITGILARLSNEESIKQSIRILIFSILGEWPHANALGSKVHNVLFEIADDITASVLQSTILNVLNKYEPRVTVLNVKVTDDADNNQFIVTLVFSINNTTTVSTLNLILSRVR